MTPEQIAHVVMLMESSERSLRELALSVGMNPFTFYQGAELNSLDLSNQDLRGMNFDKADIRFSNLEGIAFDAGSFNGSIVDNDQKWIRDEYEFYADDVFRHKIDEILIFCKFRNNTIEEAILETGLNYRDFSELSGVSVNAVRKARRGQVVALETALRILIVIRDYGNRVITPRLMPAIDTMLRQPMLAFLSGGSNMPFKIVGRDQLKELVMMREEIVEIRKRVYPNSNTDEWRDTPEFIYGMLGYYRDYKTRWEEGDDSDQ